MQEWKDAHSTVLSIEEEAIIVAFRSRAMRAAMLAGPLGAITPNSARCERKALIAWVRWRTSRSPRHPQHRSSAD